VGVEAAVAGGISIHNALPKSGSELNRLVPPGEKRSDPADRAPYDMRNPMGDPVWHRNVACSARPK